MSRRWLLGAGWVVAVTVGGAILTAVAGRESPVPVSAASAAAFPASASVAASPASVVSAPAGPSAAPGVAAAGPAAPTAAQPVQPARPAGPRTVSPPESQPVVSPGGGDVTPTTTARVAGVSYVLDILQKVISVGPGIANGVAATVLSTALAGLPGGIDAKIVEGTGKLAEQLSTEGPLTIEQARSLVAQLSVVNPDVSQALSLVAAALNGASNPALSPLDQTAHQLAEVLTSLGEPTATPSP